MSILKTTSLSDIAALDARIDDLRRQLADARRQRNALVSTTSRIPNEILSEIFEWAREACNDYRWLAFSQVSYVWREVALSNPRLWTSVDLCYTRLASEMLGRTGGANLDLYCSSDTLPIGDVWSALFLAIEQTLSANAGQRRVNSICLNTSGFAMLPQLIIPHALHLETLTLDAGQSKKVDPVPRSIQVTNFPSLRKLQLRRWSLDWRSTRMLTSATKLRTLEIVHTPDSIHTLNFTVTVTSEEMCVAFRSMTSLEALVMKCSIPCRTVEEHITPVSMPRLRNIQLEDTSRACLSLLQVLDIPEICQIKVSTYAVQDEGDRLISYLGIPTPQRISIRLSDFGSAITVTAYTTLHPRSPHHRLQVQIPRPLVARYVGNLLAELPQSTLLEVDPSNLSGSWCRSLFEMASASVVEIDCSTSGHRRNQGTLKLMVADMFPAVRTLVLKHIDFKQISNEVAHDIMQNVLVERNAAGILEVVRLFRCSGVRKNIWEGWPKLLRGVEIIECELLDAPADN